MRTAHVQSLADICPSNNYLARCFAGFLSKNGYRLVGSRDEADVVVMNGCNANSTNVDVALGYASFAKAHPAKTVLVAGCAPVLAGRAELTGPNLHLLPFTRMLHCPSDIDAAVGASVPFEFLPADGIEPEKDTPFLSSVGVDLGGLHYLRVGDGCTERCGFCAVKSAKGGLRSLETAEVLSQFEAGRALGRKKFWLMSDELGAWGQDRGTSLAALMAEMRRRESGVELFLHNVHPRFLLDDWTNVAPHLGAASFLWLSVHSGSDRVLERMARRYRADEVSELVDRARAANPDLFLATEIIVGYPGETREEFNASLRLAAKFDLVRFSPMMVLAGTPAASQDGAVGAEEILRRESLARELARRHPEVALKELPHWPQLVVWTRRARCS